MSTLLVLPRMVSEGCEHLTLGSSSYRPRTRPSKTGFAKFSTCPDGGVDGIEVFDARLLLVRKQISKPRGVLVAQTPWIPYQQIMLAMTITIVLHTDLTPSHAMLHRHQKARQRLVAIDPKSEFRFLL